MTHYATYDLVKQKLRLNDDSIQDEIEIYMSDVDQQINNALRQKLGLYDSNGNKIVFPLTTSTLPALDEELRGIAADMVVAKFRWYTTEHDDLWKEGLERLAQYLDRRFGWSSSDPFIVEGTITISPTFGPVGTVITITGSTFVVNTVITITFAGMLLATSPAIVVTDSSGAFSATITVPTGFTTGAYPVQATDRINNGPKFSFRIP